MTPSSTKVWVKIFSLSVVLAFVFSGAMLTVGSVPHETSLPIQTASSFVPGTEFIKSGVVLDTGLPNEEKQVMTPSVIKMQDGTYAMWYQALGLDGHQRIMKAVSGDGISWTRAGLAIDYGEASAEVGVQYPFVMVDSSGLFHMWYAGYNGLKNTRILHATSVDGNVWTKLGAELAYGSASDVDGVAHPRVHFDGTQWHMWYSGVKWNPLRIWTCHAHKATFSDSWVKDGIVLLNDAEYDNNVAWAAYIIPTMSGYDMFYGGRSPDQYPGRICHAYSSDGLSWTKTGIALERSLPGESSMTDFPSVIVENGVYNMWYSGYDGLNVRIFFATTATPVTESVDLSISDLSLSEEAQASGNPVAIIATVHGDPSTWANSSEETLVFSDSFDSGNLNNWIKSTWYSGSVLEVTTAQSCSPQYSFHAQSNPNTNSGPYIMKFLPDNYAHSIVKTKLYLPVKTQSIDKWDIIRVGSSTGTVFSTTNYEFYVQLRDDDYSIDLFEYVKDANGVWNYGCVAMDVCELAPATWHEISLEITPSGYLVRVGDIVVASGQRAASTLIHHLLIGDEGGVNGCWGDSYWDDVNVYSVSGTQTEVPGQDATCTVSFYLDSEDPANLIGSVGNVFVPADSETPVSLDWTAVAGEHEIIVVVSDVNPTDNDLSNNTASTQVSVIGTGVDLTVYDDDIVLPSQIVQGEQVTISASIHNLGGSESAWVKQGVVLSPGISAQYPYVIKDGSIYKMWYTGYGSTYDIYYATSTDKVNWANYGKVLTHPTGTTYAAAPSVLKEADGTYKMWYSCQNYNWNSEIYYATSADGISWTQVGKVLPIGPVGSFDSVYACQGYVFMDDGMYKMYYKAYDSGTVSRFGLATSPDGVTWTKYGSVMDTPVGYAAMECPFVLPAGNGSYDMWFTTGKILKTSSSDGINWETPVIDLDVTPGAQDSRALYTLSLLRESGSSYMYYSGDSGSTSYIFLAEMGPPGEDATCTVSFYLDSEDPANLIGSVENVFVPAGGETPVSIEWTAVEGEHEIIVVVSNVDPTDSDLSNNVASAPVTVAGEPEPAVLEVTKVRLSGPEEGIIQTYYEWELQITITNAGGYSATDILVKDVLPAELELLEMIPSAGNATTEAPGTRAALPSEQIYPIRSTHISWILEGLEPGQSETLYLRVCTRPNPAGKQEFTSPGTYIINEGAYAVGTDSLTGDMIASEPADAITVIITELQPADGIITPRPPAITLPKTIFFMIASFACFVPGRLKRKV